jgi:hypothetical protein
VSLEAGYYDSREEGVNPTIPRSQIRSLVGYQRQLWEDFTVGVQYYREDDISPYFWPNGKIPQRTDWKRMVEGHFREYSQLTTIRLTQFLRHQTVRLSFFAFFNPSGGDYMLNPEVKYSFTDHVWAAVGADIFGGSKATQFGQLRRDDNVYTQLRYEF